MFRVSHVHHTLLAGSPYWASFCLNEYLDGVESRSISLSNTNRYGDGRIYPRDLFINEGKAAEWIKSSDLVFEHQNARASIVLKKGAIRVCVYHNDGGRYPISGYDYVMCVAQKWLLKYGDKVLPFANFVPVYNSPFLPIKRKWKKPFKVVFCPSNKSGAGRSGNPKGYPQTVPILQKLKKEGLIEPIVFTGKPHLESLRIRQDCHIAIDEVVTGNYHRCSLEPASMGLAVINDIDASTLEIMSRLTGIKEHPFINANVGNLEAVIKNLVNNPDKLKQKAENTREWMLENWHPAKLWIKIFRSLGLEVAEQ